MKLIYSAALGILTGIAAVLLHIFYPPVGLVLALLGSTATIWAIGRHFGARKFKLIAFIAWGLILWRASTFGVGNELLVQGNAQGSALVFVGLISLLIATVLPA
ncbi:unannotated protein [freshwater metagenome]|jgi:hypothetical protein|uniref:Unannotated protein n=1 Tax=freshwater metagenome TaxID=449393 RepID=A0A6J6YNC2_9ZZZZ|nr:hypothetical protein [Actinomycetota bacterium]MSX20184.1 hypothetical protein [Actinomycetota bacterium]MSX70336.1 hypothetical protein [Actinomycetota bacterium]